MGQESGDDDFADFETPSSTIISIITSASASTAGTISPASTPTGVSSFLSSGVSTAAWPPGSPWYAIWQRHGPREFLVEFYILIILSAIVGAHMWGIRRNRAIAKQWIANHLPVLEKEFAMVGVDSRGRANTFHDHDGTVSTSTPEGLLLEKSPIEFVSYASGRANVAFAHISIKLQRRHNPIALFGEYFMAFIFDSMPEPADTVTITLSPFDGAERNVLASNPASQTATIGNSKYDNFIFAIVNKQTMKRHRDERYDLSLTRTADWPEKLPRWATSMSEAKELGELVLTKDLQESISGLPEGGMEYLIVTDQRIDKPTKLSECTPKKRITLLLPLSTPATFTNPLLSSFIRLADTLPTIKVLPNLARKIAATREVESKKLAKVAETELAEEREQKRAEEKKREREERLRNMKPEEQKKFLEKEREKEIRKMQKKGAKKG